MKNIEITIGNTSIEIAPGLLSGEVLLDLANIGGTQQLFLERKDDIDIPILPTDFLIVTGGEGFSIGDGAPPIEENPCLRKPIRFYFNGKKVPRESALIRPKITGAELRTYDPEGQPGDGLFVDLEGLADEPVKDDQRIIIQDKDRLITTPCGNVGDDPKPPPLLATHFDEVCGQYPGSILCPTGNQRHYLIIPDYLLPGHWIPNNTDILIIVPDGYPLASLDMFYVNPEIRLRSGITPEGASHWDTFLERRWQRFSWHYKKGWNPNRDTLLSHIRFCAIRLAQAN